jgi:hypothetical protein
MFFNSFKYLARPDPITFNSFKYLARPDPITHHAITTPSPITITITLSKTEGKLACQRDCLLNSLVMRRRAPNHKRMVIHSALSRARSVLDNV